MSFFSKVVKREMEGLKHIACRRDSTSEVWGSGKHLDHNGAERTVIWRPDEVDIKPESLFSSPKNHRLQIQMLQAGHFVLHRLNSVKHFGPIKSVTVNNGPHESNRDGFDHVRFDLNIMKDKELVKKAIHVRYDWPTGKKHSSIGSFLWDKGFTETDTWATGVIYDFKHSAAADEKTSRKK